MLARVNLPKIGNKMKEWLGKCWTDHEWLKHSRDQRHQPSFIPFHGWIIHFIDKNNQMLYPCCFGQHSMLSERNQEIAILIRKKVWKKKEKKTAKKSNNKQVSGYEELSHHKHNCAVNFYLVWPPFSKPVSNSPFLAEMT